MIYNIKIILYNFIVIRCFRFRVKPRLGLRCVFFYFVCEHFHGAKYLYIQFLDTALF